MSYPNKFDKDRAVDPSWLHTPTVYMSKVRGSKDNMSKFDFCIIQFYSNKALCAWALGCYGLQSHIYAKFLLTRWAQLTSTVDQFFYL